jgi:twitching motility protein PilI
MDDSKFKNMTTQTPYQWLQDLERRAKQKSKGLPRPEKIQQIWRGIAYRLGETLLVSTINEIREVLYYPSPLAKVPGAKTWVKGLANVRGLLLPVMDLQACLEGTPITIDRPTRVLIINQAGITAGLVVDEVLGIKHFPEQLRDLETPCQPVWVTAFARGLFSYEGSTWTVFDMRALAESDIFLKAAAG